MQKPMGKWIQFKNNEAKLVGNGIGILRELKHWDDQELHRRSGADIETIQALALGYSPKVKLETLERIAYAFGFRARGADIGEELIRFFTSQTRQMSLG